MIKVTPFESFRQHRSDVPAELKEDVCLPTLIVEHSDYSELLWVLRLTEFFGVASHQFGYQPNVQWKDNGSGVVSYADSPVVADAQIANGTCGCQVRTVEDGLSFEIDVTNQSSETWPDCWAWLCFIHRWSRAFQANCELPVGKPDHPWVAANSLEAPMERWLKWCPVAGRDEAMRIGRNQGTRWQPHIQATEGAVRAWRAHGSCQQFAQLSSPDAIILGWSHWPCTDMGVYFGTLEPGQTGRVTGKLEFFDKPYVPI
tara:strand:- start:258 stop:1031 length:774 start_codon:yes stop_codon:yes gene_type:complete